MRPAVPATTTGAGAEAVAPASRMVTVANHISRTATIADAADVPAQGSYNRRNNKCTGDNLNSSPASPTLRLLQQQFQPKLLGRLQQRLQQQ